MTAQVAGNRRVGAWGLAVLAALAIVGLAGCGSQSDSADPSEESTMPASTPVDPSSSAPGGQGALAAADLAERLGVDLGEVTVVEVEAVTWRDGSLGCPEPGKMYTQALVEGHRIELEAEGTTYTYHSGGNRSPFLCEDPQPPAP